MCKVLIIGHGYVGSAVGSIFNSKEKTIIDPKINSLTISDCRKINYDIIFVCVDTPKDEKFKTLYNVLKQLNNTHKNSIVCVKSTASPIFFKKVVKEFKDINIVFYPEYLSHHSNISDFKSQDFIILGGDNNAAIKIKKILLPRLKNVKKVSITDIQTAALVKYAENGFLSYKITFFNEMYNIHKQLGLRSSYKEFVNLLTLDKRIGSSHTDVPGRDGMKGWGGHCFTKDNLEFLNFTKSKLLEFLIKINKTHRKDI